MIHHAPITISVELMLTDGKTIAKVTWECAPGRYPTQAEIEEGNANALREAQKAMPALRVATKREWWDHYCAENYGVRYAMPGNHDWDQLEGAPR